MKNLFYTAIAILFVVTLTEPVFGQDYKNEKQLIKGADDAFTKKDFKAATPLYSTLVSNYPKDPNYNYKYGACLLLTSRDKTKPLKYLKFAVSKPDVDPMAYYYYGLTLHLNYEFKKAKAFYNKFKNTAKPTEVKLYKPQNLITQCDNGMTLLKTITDLVVLDKKELRDEDFYKVYDLSSFGGQILVKPEDFQSDYEKKNEVKDIFYFPKNADKIFFTKQNSSEGSKDIYYKVRNPDGTWSRAISMGKPVNTKYDEDYPFLHPNGDVLYFASKGHNSLGGYDIFVTRLDAQGNWTTPENLDFAINTPADDYFLITDATGQTAYFTSNRETELGKVSVYNINMERVPLDFSYVYGTFTSPSTRKALIKVVDAATNQVIGEYNTDSDGKYQIKLPNNGKYNFIVDYENSTVAHSGEVDIQDRNTFKPMKQTMEVLDQGTDNERLVIKNLMDEDVDDQVKLTPEFLKNKAKLKVNKDKYKDRKKKNPELVSAENYDQNNSNTEGQNNSNESGGVGNGRVSEEDAGKAGTSIAAEEKITSPVATDGPQLVDSENSETSGNSSNANGGGGASNSNKVSTLNATALKSVIDKVSEGEPTNNQEVQMAAEAQIKTLENDQTVYTKQAEIARKAGSESIALAQEKRQKANELMGGNGGNPSEFDKVKANGLKLEAELLERKAKTSKELTTKLNQNASASKTLKTEVEGGQNKIASESNLGANKENYKDLNNKIETGQSNLFSLKEEQEKFAKRYQEQAVLANNQRAKADAMHEEMLEIEEDIKQKESELATAKGKEKAEIEAQIQKDKEDLKAEQGAIKTEEASAYQLEKELALVKMDLDAVNQIIEETEKSEEGELYTHADKVEASTGEEAAYSNSELSKVSEQLYAKSLGNVKSFGDHSSEMDDKSGADESNNESLAVNSNNSTQTDLNNAEGNDGVDNSVESVTGEGTDATNSDLGVNQNGEENSSGESANGESSASESGLATQAGNSETNSIGASSSENDNTEQENNFSQSNQNNDGSANSSSSSDLTAETGNSNENTSSDLNESSSNGSTNNLAENSGSESTGNDNNNASANFNTSTSANTGTGGTSENSGSDSNGSANKLAENSGSESIGNDNSNTSVNTNASTSANIGIGASDENSSSASNEASSNGSTSDLADNSAAAQESKTEEKGKKSKKNKKNKKGQPEAAVASTPAVAGPSIGSGQSSLVPTVAVIPAAASIATATTNSSKEFNPETINVEESLDLGNTEEMSSPELAITVDSNSEYVSAFSKNEALNELTKTNQSAGAINKSSYSKKYQDHFLELIEEEGTPQEKVVKTYVINESWLLDVNRELEYLYAIEDEVPEEYQDNLSNRISTLETLRNTRIDQTEASKRKALEMSAGVGAGDLETASNDYRKDLNIALHPVLQEEQEKQLAAEEAAKAEERKQAAIEAEKVKQAASAELADANNSTSTEEGASGLEDGSNSEGNQEQGSSNESDGVNTSANEQNENTDGSDSASNNSEGDATGGQSSNSSDLAEGNSENSANSNGGNNNDSENAESNSINNDVGNGSSNQANGENASSNSEGNNNSTANSNNVSANTELADGSSSNREGENSNSSATSNENSTNEADATGSATNNSNLANNEGSERGAENNNGVSSNTELSDGTASNSENSNTNSSTTNSGDNGSGAQQAGNNNSSSGNSNTTEFADGTRAGEGSSEASENNGGGTTNTELSDASGLDNNDAISNSNNGNNDNLNASNGSDNAVASNTELVDATSANNQPESNSASNNIGAENGSASNSNGVFANKDLSEGTSSNNETSNSNNNTGSNNNSNSSNTQFVDGTNADEASENGTSANRNNTTANAQAANSGSNNNSTSANNGTGSNANNGIAGVNGANGNGVPAPDPNRTSLVPGATTNKLAKVLNVKAQPAELVVEENTAETTEQLVVINAEVDDIQGELDADKAKMEKAKRKERKELEPKIEQQERALADAQNQKEIAGHRIEAMQRAADNIIGLEDGEEAESAKELKRAETLTVEANDKFTAANNKEEEKVRGKKKKKIQAAEVQNLKDEGERLTQKASASKDLAKDLEQLEAEVINSYKNTLEELPLSTKRLSQAEVQTVKASEEFTQYDSYRNTANEYYKKAQVKYVEAEKIDNQNKELRTQVAEKGIELEKEGDIEKINQLQDEIKELNNTILDNEEKSEAIKEEAKVLYTEFNHNNNEAVRAAKSADPNVKENLIAYVNQIEDAGAYYVAPIAGSSLGQQDQNQQGYSPDQFSRVVQGIDAYPDELKGAIFDMIDFNKSLYNEENPIPVDTKLPGGVIYKVQIGAFRKAPPQDVFKGFAPVRGESTRPGWTRYTAGLFSSMDQARLKRNEIRALGYQDAFVVAYKDGKRIGLKEAEELIAQGYVGSPGTGVQGGANTSGSNTSGGSNQIASANGLTLAGAAATSGEVVQLSNVKGLLYTVQVGAFRSAITSNELFGISPLVEYQQGGLYKYGSGIYNDRAKAEAAKQTVTGAGVSDAFVTAFYNGKRVSMEEAAQIAQGGSSVFANEKPVSVNNNTASPEVGNIVFRVQVGAYREEVPVEDAKIILTLSNLGIDVQQNGDMTTYTVGRYSSYDEANSIKNRVVTQGLNGAFIVAYENGNRIDLQTAIQKLNR